MLLGDYEQAWAESDASPASFVRGAPLSGKRVLIRCLRGLGDAIQFLRYVPKLRELCAEVFFEPPHGLDPLLEGTPGLNPPHDLEIECSDLPYFFRATTRDIPPPLSISLDAARVRSRATALAAHRRQLKVGVVWAAGAWNPIRSFPLHLLLPLTRIPAVSLFSLQRGPETKQLLAFPSASIIDLETAGGTIADTAASISCMDLIVSPDTMVAHLAGSLRKPVWTLLPHAADWRWMLHREDTPWYPAMRLFRQPRPGDWQSVLQTVCQKLRLLRIPG